MKGEMQRTNRDFGVQLKALTMRGLTTPWCVFLLAFAIRLGIVWMGYDGDPQDTPENDEIALNLLSGKGYVASNWWHGLELRAWRAPFYPFFLATVYGVFGYGHLFVRVIQCVVGAGTAVLVFLLGRKLEPKSAPICGGFAVVYGPLAVVSNEVMTEVWFAFWLILFVYWLTPPVHKWSLIGAGVALGCAILTRPAGVALGLALGIIAVFYRTRWHVRQWVWVSGMAFLVVLPWTVRNYVVFGVWPLVSTQGGFIAARSNTTDPDWRKPHGWGVALDFLKAMPSELDRDRFWRQEAQMFIWNHPDLYIRLVGERFLHFWYFFHPQYNMWFMCILPFFLFGFYGYWRDDGYFLPSMVILVSLFLFSFVLYANSRFRLPLEPFFLIFAGSAVSRLSDQWGLTKTLWLAGGGVLINGVIAWQATYLRDGLLMILQALQLK